MLWLLCCTKSLPRPTDHARKTGWLCVPKDAARNAQLPRLFERPRQQPPVCALVKASTQLLSRLAGILWTGHADGRVCGFSLGPQPGIYLAGRLLKRWQAHRIGHVTAMCTTPWGELWTGSSRGIIRVWLGANKPGDFVVSVGISSGLGDSSVAGGHPVQ